MLTLLCYHWECGACLSGVDPDFDALLQETQTQYGTPSRVTRSVHQLGRDSIFSTDRFLKSLREGVSHVTR